MKKLFTILALALFAATAQAQIKQDHAGNFYAEQSVKEKPVPTGQTFTDLKGNVYPVYKSPKGKLFVIRTSKKTGKQYNQYLN